jgi:GNAT superfamily N-acetyltransferase
LPAELRHGEVPGTAALERAYQRGSAAFLAVPDDRTAGCVVLDALDASVAVMRRLYIRPAFRRRGLARALVLRACDFARSAGFERVVLDTDKETLPDAYALYRSLGFTDCPPYAAVPYENATFLGLSLK